MTDIGKLTTNSIKEIKYLTDQLSYMLGAHEFEFWLAVDGTQLERIEGELQTMIDDMNSEVDKAW